MDAGSSSQVAAAGQQSPEGRLWPALSGLMSRDELFAGLLIISCANAFAGRVLETSREFGWQALTAGFYVSAIVWVALFAALRLVLRKRESEPLRPQESRIKAVDLVVAGAVLGLVAFPVPTLNWFAVTLASIYAARYSPTGSPLQRGSLICLAITGPMFWGPALMNAYFEPFQKLDALFVSAITGTERVGGMVRMADGAGYLIIENLCSSFHNLSQAILAMVTITQFVGSRRILAMLGWCLLACASVIAINVGRISLIGLYPAHYDILHGTIVRDTAGWLTLGLIALICYLGVRRDLLPRS